MLYKFEWAVWITDELVARIAQLSGADAGYVDSQRPLLANILQSVGGFPISERVYSATEKTTAATTLLHEATRHVLACVFLPGSRSGVIKNGPSSFSEAGSLASVVPGVDLNSAGADVIAGLPEIGLVIARRIVEERLRRGPFTSLDDLDRRVAGLGAIKVRRIAALVTLEDPAEALRSRWSADTFDADFPRLLSLQSATTPNERLAGALETLAMKCAQDPHPYTKNALPRDFAAPSIAALSPADWISVLAGESYFERLPTLFGSAQRSIDVCMFHIAFPSEQHPTGQLLEALRDAHDRGVAVRVLVDRDRTSDPYHSTVINTRAKQFFADNGIDCRYDEEDRLLHSKFLTIDDALAIIGSHNWSAGSYFDFDDVSLAVRSEMFNATLRQRFETLWPSS